MIMIQHNHNLYLSNIVNYHKIQIHLIHIITYTYSSLNQKLSKNDALNARTQFEYDGNGNLVKVTDGNGNITSYSYDAVNRTTSITFANGLSQQYGYDELGRIIKSKDCI